MSAGQKERVAGSMVRLMLATGKYKDYLTDLMELEVKRLGTEQEALLFRENSIGSKSIESFLKLGTVSILIFQYHILGQGLTQPGIQRPPDFKKCFNLGPDRQVLVGKSLNPTTCYRI